MNDLKKSDAAIVAVKPANKGRKRFAEQGEPRAATEGNPGRQTTRRAQKRASVPHAGDRVRQAASQRLTVWPKAEPDALARTSISVRRARDPVSYCDGDNQEIQRCTVHKHRKAFLRKWHLKCRAVADSLEEASGKLFTFTRLPKSQWKSARTANAIERLDEAFKRRIKTQIVLLSPETVPILFWALMASGQIQMRKIDGWETPDQPLTETLDFAA